MGLHEQRPDSYRGSKRRHVAGREGGTQHEEQAVAQKQDVRRPKVEQRKRTEISELEREQRHEQTRGRAAPRPRAEGKGRGRDERERQNLRSHVKRKSRLRERVGYRKPVEEGRTRVMEELRVGSEELSALERLS